jgi:hypothetical protein
MLKSQHEIMIWNHGLFNWKHAIITNITMVWIYESRRYAVSVRTCLLQKCIVAVWCGSFALRITSLKITWWTLTLMNLSLRPIWDLAKRTKIGVEIWECIICLFRFLEDHHHSNDHYRWFHSLPRKKGGVKTERLVWR